MSKKQLEAYKLLTDGVTTEICYGGGARGGKSRLGCMWIALQCQEKPGSQWMIARETLLSLKQSTLLEFWQVIDELGIPRTDIHYRQDEQMIVFKNGSRIFTKGIPFEPQDPEYNYLGSFTLTGYFIDEAQEIREKAIDILRGRCSLTSKTDADGNILWTTVPKSLYTCNPDKGWIYRLFYRPFKDKKLETNRAFVPALVIDNPFIPTQQKKDYIENLKKGDKVTVQRLLFGNFEYDSTAGRLFEYDALKDMFTNPEYTGKRYITCDLARGGEDSDRTVIMVWDGYVVKYVYHYSNQKLDFTQKKIKELAQDWKIPMSQVLVDENGIGGGPVDTLKCRGFIGNRKAISPISKKYRPELTRNYSNQRAQCLMMMSRLVNDRRISIQDSSIEKELVQELDLVCWTNFDKDAPIALTSTDEIMDKIRRSPDFMSAFYIRSWFDLFLNDKEMSESERIFNPHIDEDLYGHRMMEKGIDEWLEGQRRAKNTYEAELAKIL